MLSVENGPGDWMLGGIWGLVLRRGTWGSGAERRDPEMKECVTLVRGRNREEGV